MSETKFTLGPWVIHETRHPNRYGADHIERWIITERDHPQSRMPDPIVTSAVCVGTEQTGPLQIVQINEANARLIAAAPDLYAVLKVAQLWLDIDGRYDMQGINAALAKAEGRP
jgi:hypothetical protein